jgi:hypothetical protein
LQRPKRRGRAWRMETREKVTEAKRHAAARGWWQAVAQRLPCVPRVREGHWRVPSREQPELISVLKRSPGCCGARAAREDNDVVTSFLMHDFREDLGFRWGYKIAGNYWKRLEEYAYEKEKKESLSVYTHKTGDVLF